jgi:hypothetical protein
MKSYTFYDADNLIVSQTYRQVISCYIKFEGYLDSDLNSFVVAYFDCPMEFAEFMINNLIFHIGNVSYVEEQEFVKALAYQVL